MGCVQKFQLALLAGEHSCRDRKVRLSTQSRQSRCDGKVFIEHLRLRFRLAGHTAGGGHVSAIGDDFHRAGVVSRELSGPGLAEAHQRKETPWRSTTRSVTTLSSTTLPRRSTPIKAFDAVELGRPGPDGKLIPPHYASTATVMLSDDVPQMCGVESMTPTSLGGFTGHHSF